MVFSNRRDDSHGRSATGSAAPFSYTTRLCLLVLSLLLFHLQVARAQTANAAAQAPTPSVVEAVETARQDKSLPVSVKRFEQRPVIDGRLDEEVWKRAAVLSDFVQVQPGDNTRPSQQTEVLLGYDAQHFYMGFRARDEPGKVRVTVPKRDAVSDDDNVGVYLDTFNDKRRAYKLVFNPLGVQADAIYTEARGDDFTVDVVMESKGTLNDDGYEVEVAVPFKSLRYKAGKGELWGIHVFREIKRLNNERDSWVRISRDKSGFLNQSGYLTGLEDILAGRLLEVIPSLTVTETGDRVRTLSPALAAADPTLVDNGRLVNRPLAPDAGLNVKLGISSQLTLDFAFNPDFAQVEADQTVVTANQRFPIFFPEKRPFFLEGIEMFRTPLNAVNTRTIIDPDVAAKLTGKRGRSTFGLLLASDNAPGNFSREERSDPNVLPRISRFLDKNAYIAIARFMRDVGKESNVGFVATSYNFIERHSHLAGFDGRFRLDQQTTVDFQILGTTSRRFFFDAEAGRNVFRTGNGLGYFGRYQKMGRRLTVTLAGAGRTRFYRTEVGFTRRFNTNQYELLVSYGSEPRPKARLTSWRFYNFSRTNFDFQRRMQLWDSDSGLTLEFPRQTSVTVSTGRGYERLFEEEFGVKRTASRAGAFNGADPERSSYNRNVSVSARTTPSKHYSMNVTAAHRWDAFDFDFGGGLRFPRVSPAALLNPRSALDPGAGNLLDISGAFTYQPTNALRASLQYTRSRLVRQDTRRVAFDAHIFALRSTYQFTRFLFARARLDYDTLASNIRGQYLLGWTPSPGTALYVGYNDDLNRNGFNPFTGQREQGIRLNHRTFFIKSSYLFRRNF